MTPGYSGKRSRALSEPMEEVLDLDAFTAATIETSVDPEVGKIEFDVRKALAGPDAQLYHDAIAIEKDGIAKYDVMTDCLITDVPSGEKIFGSFMLTLRTTNNALNEVI